MTNTEQIAAMAERIEKLEGAVELVRGIIVEAALTGFNPFDGDWATRLFESQAITKAALLSSGDQG